MNNVPVLRNYRDIEFTLRCMDVLASNAQISMNWNLMLNFVKSKKRIFTRHSSCDWPNTGLGETYSYWNRAINELRYKFGSVYLLDYIYMQNIMLGYNKHMQIINK